MSKIRVLHLLQSPQFSGAENVVCQIIRMFENDEGYEMAYCSPDGQIRKVLHEKGIMYIPLSKLTPSVVREVVKEYNPSIIHAHDANAAVNATLAMSKVPIVVHIHGNHINMRSITIKSVLVKYLSRRWNKIVWVSKSAFTDYKFADSVYKRSIILENVIDQAELLNRVGNSKENIYDCIFLGRINSIKNPMRAIKIFQSVLSQKPDFRAVFVGNGDLLEDCKKYIAQNGMDDRILMLGYQDNPIGTLYASKVLVMTSVYEGTPMSALEAMGLGKPIISTPTDGILDLVDQQVTGFYSDKDEELVGAILDLLSNDERYLEMKQSTLKRFEMLMDVNRYKNVLVDIYREATGEKNG